MSFTSVVVGLFFLIYDHLPPKIDYKQEVYKEMEMIESEFPLTSDSTRSLLFDLQNSYLAFKEKYIFFQEATEYQQENENNIIAYSILNELIDEIDDIQKCKHDLKEKLSLSMCDGMINSGIDVCFDKRIAVPNLKLEYDQVDEKFNDEKIEKLKSKLRSILENKEFSKAVRIINKYKEEQPEEVLEMMKFLHKNIKIIKEDQYSSMRGRKIK